MMNVESDRPIPDPNHPTTWSKPPSWLLVPGAITTIPTPPETRPPLLPFNELDWEDFERLCLRLLELEAEIQHVEEVNRRGVSTGLVSRMYGQRGQAQFGIDMYSRDPVQPGKESPKRRYVCLQARRIKKVAKSALQRSVSDFLASKWSPVARKFIYATSCSGVRTQFTDELEVQAEKLAKNFIELEVWDQEKMSQLLRDQPRLVDDFFGRAWVSIFCGSSQAKGIGHRLDAYQVADLRRKLSRIYDAVFHAVDSGMLALSGTAKSIQLQDRFVSPDVFATTPGGATEPIDCYELAKEDNGESLYDISSDEFVLSRSDYENERMLVGFVKRRLAATRMVNTEDRWAAETWLGSSMQQVIVGEPGAGKSTLLRYMVMDLLSDEPSWSMVAERWGGRLPVWLPFHYFTQRVADTTGQPASISATIQAWLEQHDFGDVWPLVEKALADERLLLVVDGLDEWVSDEAGRYAAAALETFVKAHSAAVVVTTRPYGLARLTLGAGWDFAHIAPLTGEQQRELAKSYFANVIAGSEGEDAVNTVTGLVDTFLSDIRSSPDLTVLSGIPLFMVLLIGLRLLTGGRLPERRFEVYDRAVQLLLSDHPQRRRVAAAVTTTRGRLSEREIRSLFAEVAYHSQERGDISTISENALRGDLVAALSSPDHLGVDAASARDLANDILDIAEGEIGLLVRKGPKEFGFLHRMIQEQLAAEHIAYQMEPGEVMDLFAKYVGEPFWREVLLAIVWHTKRPTELRNLVEIINDQVGETPAGLRARELLAEIVFGQHGLPADEIQTFAPMLVEVAETHPYGTHRLRLIEAIFSGLDNIVAQSIVETCVSRWAVLADRPTTNLVWSAVQLPADKQLSLSIVRLLLLAIRQPDLSLAFGSAVSIVKRCSSEGQGSTVERVMLKEGLLKLLADPPSGICQSAALAALALGWRKEPLIDCAMHEARSHTYSMVRLVALADAVGVLSVSLTGKESITSTKPLQASERDWLLGRLENTNNIEMHQRLLAETIAQVMKGNLSDLEYLLKRMQENVGFERELIWDVGLKAFSDEERVVDRVCELLRTNKYLHPLRTLMGDGEALKVYAPPSPNNSAVAQAIEDHLTKFGYEHRDRELFILAGVDRGPVIKSALIAGLKTASFPYWAAAALRQYFLQDKEVKHALREVLFGDAVQASKVANAAGAVLDPDEAVQRLLDILKELGGRTDVRGRADIVAHALIEVCKNNRLTSGDAGENIASQAIELIPPPVHLFGDPTYDLAVAFYPTRAAKNALDALEATEGHLVTPFLEAYREEPEMVAPFLDEAMCIIGSIPTQMRIRLCQLLSERSVSPELVLDATKRWADEISGRNKSYASLAYHRSLIEARQKGLVNDEKWEQTKAVLMQEASCYGPDYESRRRAAWVGMAVLKDWSIIEGLCETIGEPSPVGVSLGEVGGAPDIVLLQQVASHWRDLRVCFGDDLLGRLSGGRNRDSLQQAWAALAVVATQYPEVERELEAAVEDNSELLKEESILLWFVSQPKRNPETAADALVASLFHAETNLRGLADLIIAEPERIGIEPNSLRSRLESVVDARPLESGYGNRPLEALAVAFPGHDLVRAAWIRIKEAQGKGGADRQFPLLHPQTHIAVAYSEGSSEEVLNQLRLNLAWMKRTDKTLFDEALTRHLSSRLRRDDNAAQMIADAIVAPDTPDAEAAELASLLSVSVPLSEEILGNLERRLEAQMEAKLVPVVQDRVLSVSLSTRTLLTKIIEVLGSR